MAESPAASSHGIGLGSTVELGRVLGRLPRRLIILAVSGREFGFGIGLTPEVAAAIEPVVERVRDLIGQAAGTPRSPDGDEAS